MTTSHPTALVPPRTLRADDRVTTWHGGLVQGPRWLALALLVVPAPEVVSAHRSRYDPAASPEERRRAVSMLDAVQVTVTNRDTTDKPVELWQGGTQGLDPLAVHLFTDHTLPPGRYTLEIRINKPDGANGTYSDHFEVPGTGNTGVRRA